MVSLSGSGPERFQLVKRSPRKEPHRRIRFGSPVSDELRESNPTGDFSVPHTMLPTTEGIISDILNWVCPECGGPMGGRTKEFKCQGECRTDWRDVWERSLRATTPQHLRPANSNGSETQDDARIQKRLTAFTKSLDCRGSLRGYHLGTADVLRTSVVQLRMERVKRMLQLSSPSDSLISGTPVQVGNAPSGGGLRKLRLDRLRSGPGVQQAS